MNNLQVGKTIFDRISTLINKKLPNIYSEFNGLTDSRPRFRYSMAEIMTGSLFMFILKEGSRNAYNNDWRSQEFREKFDQKLAMNIPGADAIDDVLRLLPPQELETLKAWLCHELIESKTFRKERMNNKYYTIAFDATQITSFDHRHCEHCLTNTYKSGKIRYFHNVLEAKLVTSSGLAISLGSEFIDNPAGGEYQKQDCEQKAFHRLSQRIKHFFPRLPICVLLDGLYPNATIFGICRKYDWRFIITLQDGNLPSFQQEVNLLQNTATRVQSAWADKNHRISSEFSFLNDVMYGKHCYSWMQLIETHRHKVSGEATKTNRFVYITDLAQSRQSIFSAIHHGRNRWVTENQGFNVQKNENYNIEHKYSRVSYTAMQNYYRVAQIAHIINQLLQLTATFIQIKSEYSKRTIRAIWKSLLLYLLSPETNTCNAHTDTG